MKPNPASLLARWSTGLWLGAAVLLGSLPSAATAAGSGLPPLTTVSGSPRLPGKFVWADLATDDVPAASAFYSKLFGWTFQDLGGYTIALNHDNPVGGLFHPTLPKSKDAKPRWIGFISVPNIEKAEKAVTASGGKVLAAPQKFPKRGEQAVFADAEGAVFGVIKSSAGDPEDFLPDPGDWIWVQLLSRDAAQAGAFYKSVAGYEVVANESTGRTNSFVLTSQGFARATLQEIPATFPDVQPAWLPFVRVANLAESLAMVNLSGGKTLLEPKAELLAGKLAIIADPTGAAIGIMEWSQDAAQGGTPK